MTKESMMERHDIAHCNGSDCDKRDNCHRYIMHIEARNHELIWLAYCNPATCIEKNHNMFWEKQPYE